MKDRLSLFLERNNTAFLIASALRLLQKSSFKKTDGSKKKYPKVIQLPITYKCNSKCVMCNIWKMDSSNEAKPDEFAQFIKDPIFKEVHSVGINGGEPSLLPNLPEYVKEILTLPKLTSLNIISNGFDQRSLLKSLEEIYPMCRDKNVNFHVSISLDGVGKVHDTVRRTPGAFKRTISTIEAISINRHQYCDSSDLGCTVLKHNIDFLMELDSYVRAKKYSIKYRLGVENLRIQSDQLVNQFSILSNSSRQTAKEFFHYQMTQAKSMQDKFKYFSIFFWLNVKNPKRLLGCIWKDEGVTLDSRGELYYCAVASRNIGSLRKEQGERIFFDEKNINYRKTLISKSCDGCIHDYSGKPELTHIFFFLRAFIFQKTAMNIYRLRAWFL